MGEEVVKEEKPKEETSSVDLAGRVLLLETKVLLLETKLSVWEKESAQAPQVLKQEKPKINIYGTDKRIR
jgi:hypothetical protein